MRTIVRIICSTLEKYFWNLVRIRKPIFLRHRVSERKACNGVNSGKRVPSNGE